jgi:hypothetical protein
MTEEIEAIAKGDAPDLRDIEDLVHPVAMVR